LIQQFSIFLLSIFLIGCVPQNINTPQLTPTSLPSTIAETHDVLVDFFTLLNEGKYDEAEPLYGGSYESLQVFNPEIDPSDHTALWAWACEKRLLQCLKVRSATFQRLEGDTYVFQVEFSNEDSSLFVLGPCCGANETEMPPVSQFEYRVSRTAPGKFTVMELPPYIP
jgi:hypothetical protein